MTTIAVKDGIMVGDGRCSLGSTIIKDDMVKVFWINNHLMGGAGRARSISTFADWLQKHTDYTIVNQEVGDLVALIPPVLQDDEEFTALVLTPDKQVLMYDGNVALNLGNDVAASIGSGSVFALAAMDAGSSAEEAVRIAMKRDVYSGGEVTVVQLEEEPQELTREVAERMSKEDLLVAMFGEEEEEEANPNTDIDVCSEEGIELKQLHVWTEQIILWGHVDTKEILFEVDGTEYTVKECTFAEYKPEFTFDMDIAELRSVCGDMSIETTKQNTKQQLINKIFKEVKSKIPQE